MEAFNLEHKKKQTDKLKTIYYLLIESSVEQLISQNKTTQMTCFSNGQLF